MPKRWTSIPHVSNGAVFVDIGRGNPWRPTWAVFLPLFSNCMLPKSKQMTISLSPLLEWCSSTHWSSGLGSMLSRRQVHSPESRVRQPGHSRTHPQSKSSHVWHLLLASLHVKKELFKSKIAMLLPMLLWANEGVLGGPSCASAHPLCWLWLTVII